MKFDMEEIQAFKMETSTHFPSYHSKISIYGTNKKIYFNLKFLFPCSYFLPRTRVNFVRIFIKYFQKETFFSIVKY